MALTKEEFREKMVAGTAKAAAERAAGLRPPRKNAKGSRRATPSGGFVAPPPPDVTQTVEFQSALDMAVTKAKDEILAAVAQKLTTQTGTPVDALEQMTEQLAMSIGNLTNQNSGQKLVSPEVVAARRAAERKMHERLHEAQIAVRDAVDDEAADLATPKYRLTAKIIAPLMNGPELVEPMRRGGDNRVYPTELGWLLPPSLAMAPINDPAREIFALFKELIGNQAGTRVTSFTPVRDVLGREIDGVPQFGPEPAGFVTNQGRVVTTASATMALHNGFEVAAPQSRTGDRSAARILNQEANRQHSGPPTVQVRVLGTIAPPAVQNG